MRYLHQISAQEMPTEIIASQNHAHYHLAKTCPRQLFHTWQLIRKLISLPAATIWQSSYLSTNYWFDSILICQQSIIFAGGNNLTVFLFVNKLLSLPGAFQLPAIIMSSGLPVWSRVTDVIETQRQRCKYNQFEKTMQCKNSKHCPSLSRGHFKCNQFHKRSQEPRDTLRLLGGRVHSRGHGVGHSS